MNSQELLEIFLNQYVIINIDNENNIISRKCRLGKNSYFISKVNLWNNEYISFDIKSTLPNRQPVTIKINEKLLSLFIRQSLF